MNREARSLSAVEHIGLTLLGGFHAQLSPGPSLTVPTRKAQALLAYLALPCGAAHPRDKVAALLWADMREEKARANLRQTLYLLRRALPSPLSDSLRPDAEHLILGPAAVDVDVATFERLAIQGTPDTLAHAAAVYRGDLLEGLAVREGPFEDWLMAERERLRELALETLAKLLAQQRATGATEVALQTALRLLALDPLLETVHRTLMRLYAELGRRDTALRQYQMCVSVLRRELGVEPEAETTRLYQDILRVRSLRAPADAVSPGRGVPSHDEVHHLHSLAPGIAIPLVGREQDVARLRQAMAETDGGRGRMAMILGETGTGKTRLVGELVNEALASGARRTLIGRCCECEPMVPFGIWSDMFRRARINDELTALHENSPWRSELGQLLPELDWTTTAGGVGPADHVRLFEAVAQLLRHLAAKQPLLLVVEDLHWADEMSVRLLVYLGRRIHDWPILLVATASTDELPDAGLLNRWLEAMERDANALRLVLDPLTHPDTVRLVRSLALAGTPESALARVAEQIWRISDGNAAVAVGAIRAPSTESMPSAAPDVLLPFAVRQSIIRRLDRLAKNAQVLAAVGAVLGRAFDFRLIALAAGLAEADAAEAVEELVRRAILSGDGDCLSFTYDRVREVAYGRLLAPRRRLLHRAVAEALETLHTSDADAHCATIGWHYLQAEVWPKATSYMRAAAAAAVAHAAYREATTCLEHALASSRHLPDDCATRALAIDLRLDLCQALASLGERPRVLDTLRETETLAEKLVDQSGLAPVWSRLAEYSRLAGDSDRAAAAERHAMAAHRRRRFAS